MRSSRWYATITSDERNSLNCRLGAHTDRFADLYRHDHRLGVVGDTHWIASLRMPVYRNDHARVHESSRDNPLCSVIPQGLPLPFEHAEGGPRGILDGRLEHHWLTSTVKYRADSLFVSL